MNYEIVIDTLLPERMIHYFEPMKVTRKDTITLISGNVVDQSALFGLIATIRDLNLKLVSINPKQKEIYYESN